MRLEVEGGVRTHQNSTIIRILLEAELGEIRQTVETQVFYVGIGALGFCVLIITAPTRTTRNGSTVRATGTVEVGKGIGIGGVGCREVRTTNGEHTHSGGGRSKLSVARSRFEASLLTDCTDTACLPIAITCCTPRIDARLNTQQTSTVGDIEVEIIGEVRGEESCGGGRTRCG